LVDGKEYSVPSTGITMGRDASAGVVVAQNEVSRKHAKIVPVEDGYEVHDFSANGVFVNGARVNRAQILSRADVIRIGTEEFRFYADVRPTDTPARPMPASRAAVATPAAPSLPAPAVQPEPLIAQGFSMWVWIVVALAIAGAAALSALGR
jgi:pSer/pThr/pTyr-binding forkhead associated (FHA) protein